MVYNQDVRGLASRINRFITEVALCASSNLANMSEFDQTRLEAYIAAMRAYQGWIVAQPHLDLPETAPRQYALDADAEVPTVDNEAVRDVLVMLQVARDELISSQSARMPTGLLPFDADRVTRVVDKVEAFLNQYIRVVQPLDLPESSPARAMTPTGKTGV